MRQKYILLLVLLLFVVSSCKKETEIEETAISLKDLRDIGELITAEYYGEVVESLQETYMINDLSHLQEAYEKIREEYIVLGRRYQRPIRRVRKFRKLPVHDSDEYKILMKATKNFISFSGDRKFLEESVWKKDWNQFYADNRESIDRFIVKKNDKTELVYLARGWVKAGFDLSKIDTSIMFVDRDTLFVQNVNPMIFDVDINPWFIPGKSKGYELVRTRNENKINFDQVAAVKMACIEKMRRDAIERGILNTAREAAEEIFSNFFSSLQIEEFKGKPFHYISIVTTPYFEEEADVLADHKVDSLEVLRLDFLMDADTKFDETEQSVLKRIDALTKGKGNHALWYELLGKAIKEEE